MRNLLIVILLVVAGMLIAAEAPKKPAAETKKAPPTEVKKEETVETKKEAKKEEKKEEKKGENKKEEKPGDKKASTVETKPAETPKAAPAAAPAPAKPAEAQKTPAAAPAPAKPAEAPKTAPAAAPAAPVKPAEEAKKEEPKKEEAAPKVEEAKKAEEAPKGPALPEPKSYDIKEETVADTKTGLVWQRKRTDKSMTHKEAEDYCGTLTLAGADDWRLPTVAELRTLIVGCQSGTPACKVDDQCLSSKCWSAECACQALKGPGEEGFYWQKDVWQGGGKYFWSSSLRPGKKSEKAWDVGFNYGNVYEYDRTQKADVRCVRIVPK